MKIADWVYWIFAWELMEGAISLIRLSTGLRIWHLSKCIEIIDLEGLEENTTENEVKFTSIAHALHIGCCPTTVHWLNVLIYKSV